MKIRYLAIVYTAIILGAIAFISSSFSDSSYVVRDMVFYNEQSKLVQSELERGKSADWVEKEYSCSILLFIDPDYETRINELLREDALVVDYYENGEIIGKIAWNEEKQAYNNTRRKLLIQTIIVWALILCAGYMLLLIVYRCFIHPFRELQEFSSQIAKGNLDFPLPVHKNNFFGAFTESFDIMREELKKAKENEYEANRSKRELVAELSHDIKTPISTIKATCEVMQLKEKNPDTLDKVGVIEDKAETVDRLIGNMFHATLEELEVLKVEPEEESSLCIVEIIKKLKYSGEIVFENDIPECLVYIDKLRLEQVVDNIINNSYKYAGTTVTVCFRETGDGIKIRISDNGPGVEEDELALITEKYYRGSNTSGKSGSGLGLYLSKLFMEQMRGGLECYNQNGFVVELFVRKV